MGGYPSRGDSSFTGNSFRCYPVLFSFQTKIRSTDMRREKEMGRTQGCMQYRMEHGAKLKHPAVCLLPDRRKWDGTQSPCLLKTDPLCLGLLRETPEAHLCACCTLLLSAQLVTSTCTQTDDLHCPASVCFHFTSLCPVILLSTCCTAVSTRTTNVATLNL